MIVTDMGTSFEARVWRVIHAAKRMSILGASERSNQSMKPTATTVRLCYRTT
jgi:hypothetical protein